MTARLLAAVLLASAALAGCSSSDDDPSSAPTPTSTVPVWNPCDGLHAKTVARALGTDVRMATGTDDNPRCAFLPKQDGEAVVTVTYQLAPGGLDAIFGSVGHIDNQVTEPRIPRSDDARMVVNAKRRAMAVTGAVQNGSVVQVVNILDPRPYDRGALVRTTKLVLRDLAKHADRAGVE